VGGWGGGTVGISSLDDKDASQNETTKIMAFQKEHWYPIRVRVTKDRLQCWIDEQPVVDVKTTGKKISIRGEVELSRPLGFATWQTAAALKNIRLRKVAAE